MEYYWHLELYSKEIIKVKPNPANIKAIQDKIAKQEGALTTATRSIVIKDIRDFRLSDEPYTDQKLLEDASQAFQEPVETNNGISARYVKKSVPRRRWDTFYRSIPGYRLLQDGDSFVMMAFTLPVHQIDHQLVQELTPDEELRMSKTY